MNQDNSLGIYANQFQGDYTQGETNQFTIEFNEITKGFQQALSEGLNPADPKVQELVKKHFDFISKFWTPTKAAYKSLAMSYILPSPYKDTYEAIQQGLGKYHYDAIVIWADQKDW